MNNQVITKILWGMGAGVLSCAIGIVFGATEFMLLAIITAMGTVNGFLLKSAISSEELPQEKSKLTPVDANKSIGDLFINQTNIGERNIENDENNKQPELLKSDTKEDTQKQYKIIKKIGEGIIGVVYKAKDTKSNSYIAMKKIKSEISKKIKHKERFIEAAKTCAKLKHPNITKIYNMYEDKDTIYLIYEYINGTSLKENLSDNKKLTINETKKIFLQLCNAFEYVHGKDIIHGYIKPSFIMLDDKSTVKISDFVVSNVAYDILYKVTGISNETKLYLAPEQYAGKPPTPESDVYSLGIILYEMLTGEAPFKGDDILLKKGRMVYESVTSLVRNMPKQVDKIINRCLQPQKKDRFNIIMLKKEIEIL